MGCACVKPSSKITPSVVRKSITRSQPSAKPNQGKKRNSINQSTLESELSYNQKHLDSEQAISIEEDWSVLANKMNSKGECTPSALGAKRKPLKKVDPLHLNPRFNLDFKFTTQPKIEGLGRTDRHKLPRIKKFARACSRPLFNNLKPRIEINKDILSSSDSSYDGSSDDSSQDGSTGQVVYRRKRKILTSIFNEKMHEKILIKSQKHDGDSSESFTGHENVGRSIKSPSRGSGMRTIRNMRRTSRRCMTTKLPPLFNKSFRPCYKVNLLSKLSVGQSSFTPFAGLRPVQRSHQGFTFSQYVDQIDSKR